MAGESIAPGVNQRGGKRVTRDAAVFAQAGGGLRGVGGWQEVDADAGDGVRSVRADGGFHEDAAQFAPVQIEVVRPFHSLDRKSVV